MRWAPTPQKRKALLAAGLGAVSLSRSRHGEPQWMVRVGEVRATATVDRGLGRLTLERGQGETRSWGWMVSREFTLGESTELSTAPQYAHVLMTRLLDPRRRETQRVFAEVCAQDASERLTAVERWDTRWRATEDAHERRPAGP